MIPGVTDEELKAFASADLHEAEQKFESFKTRLLSRATHEGSLTRVRQSLKVIENILAEKHDARRARRRARDDTH